MSAETHITPQTAVADNLSGREFKKLGYRLYVHISDDKLECRCSYLPAEQGSMLTREELHEFLTQAGIKEGLLQESLEDFAIKAAAGQGLERVLLAAGTPPAPGVDGWLSYTAQPSVTVVHAVDEQAQVDHHNVQSFINVMPGDEIGRIVPPQPGKAGRSVTGQEIPPAPVKPLVLKIGDNILLEEEGSLLRAARAGRVCVVSGEISVSEEYIISGDVNFHVGSITFNGFVEIRGDVLDGFNITAVKGLRVNGNIGACTIRSDGDISFCGMDGQEKGSIVCGGAISANFIHNCMVECGGDLTADVELHNCHVRTTGRITVNKGAIAGGSYTALGGIETKKAGSAASVRTVLRAGVDYHDLAEFEHVMAALEENSAQSKKAGSFEELDALRKERADLTDQLISLRSRSQERANPKINVRTILYDNTFLCIGLEPKQKTDERDGPFSVIENTIDGGLRFLPITGLDVKAGDIELAYVREAALQRYAQ